MGLEDYDETKGLAEEIKELEQYNETPWQGDKRELQQYIFDAIVLRCQVDAKGAEYNDIRKFVLKRMSKDEFDDNLNELLNSGDVYEPLLSRLKNAHDEWADTQCRNRAITLGERE